MLASDLLRYTKVMRLGFSLSVLAVVGLVGCGEPASLPLIGGQPEVSAASGSDSLELDGRPFDLWKGRESAVATVLVFTRTDCPISNRYAPTLRSLGDAWRPRGVDFFLVYVDPQEDADGIRRHQQEYQLICPGIRDPLHALVAQCGATVTPEAVVFDSQRKIVYRGRIDDLFAAYGESRTEATTHELADAIDAVVAGRPVAQPVTKAVGCYIADLE
jgi:Redoxin